MPRRLASFRLWAAVIALSLTGLAAMAFGAEGTKPQPQRAWSHSAAN